MDKIEIFEETDRSKKQGKLHIVVPCNNEEEALEASAHSLIKKLEDLISKELISEESRIVFVDDGSKDKTWQIIQSLFQKEEKVIQEQAEKLQYQGIEKILESIDKVRFQIKSNVMRLIDFLRTIRQKYFIIFVNCLMKLKLFRNY